MYLLNNYFINYQENYPYSDTIGDSIIIGAKIYQYKNINNNNKSSIIKYDNLHNKNVIIKTEYHHLFKTFINKQLTPTPMKFEMIDILSCNNNMYIPSSINLIEFRNCIRSYCPRKDSKDVDGYTFWHDKTQKDIILGDKYRIFKRQLITDYEIAGFINNWKRNNMKSDRLLPLRPIIEKIYFISKQKIIIARITPNRSIVLFDDDMTNYKIHKQKMYVNIHPIYGARMPLGGGFYSPSKKILEKIINNNDENKNKYYKNTPNFKYFLSNFIYLSKTLNDKITNNSLYLYTKKEIKKYTLTFTRRAW